MGSIYKIINNVNGKVYIGQTRNGINLRWRQHINSCSCETARDYNTYLHVAMRKYGTGAFSIEEIETCNNMELDDREIFWIAYYQSFNKKYGYNLTLGGSGSQKYTDEEILKMWNEGKTIGEIHDESKIDRGWISIRLKACGVTDDEISRRRYRSAGEKQCKPVYQYALNGAYIKSFKSINEARRLTGIGHIEKCYANKQKQAGGFQWSYQKLDKMPPYEYIKLGSTSKEVIQIEEDTQKIIAEYKSMSDASRITGIDISGIAKTCRCEQYTAGGYIWECKQ